MKTQNKRLISRISQAGSLMIEAMAMLALISLVTPTLYKKSAERTTELQDINTATHVRTVMKAVDNYAAANYQELIHDLGEGQVKNIEIDDETYASFFPYGYKFDDLKNFDKPKVALRRQGNSITSFVQFPKKTDVGEMRAARIASMVGSNGGYVDGSGTAKGVGGVWSLAKGDLGGLNFDSNKGSVVVASSEAINSANSAALENEKYLQRTKVESEDQKWRNAMTTDLYMGGVAEANDMYKILGVEQLIIGSSDPLIQSEDLVISADSKDGGSAWLAGNLSAISNKFTVTEDDAGPELFFGESTGNYTISAVTDDVSFNDGNVEFIKTTDDGIGATFKVNTQVEKGLNVFGDTNVATDAGAVFKAGVDGSYITADASSVNLQGGNVVVNKSGSGDAAASSTNINTGTVNIKGDTKIGEGAATPVRTDLNPKLNVQGNTFVSGILEAGEINTKKFKTLELHAGGDSYDDNKQWLNATKEGVNVINPNLLTSDNKILEINNVTSALYSPKGKKGDVGPAVILGDNNAQMRGEDYAAIYTTKTEGYLTLQNGAMELSGTQDQSDNRIDMNASITSVNNGVFQVQGSIAGDDTDSINSLHIDPISGGKIEIGAHSTTVRPSGAKGFFEVVKEDGQKILNVTPDGVSTDNPAIAEVDAKGFRVSYVNPAEAISSGVILDVDASDYKPNTKDSTANLEGRDVSVYIRRGAIELESSSGVEYTADNGVGYIAAGRFVANTKYDGSNIDIPEFSRDTKNDRNYNEGTPYDRYLVNPAYTSVMHDIKLTTRGGARLSDILPDFINKGIYVVNNTYEDNLDINNLEVTQGSGRLVANGAEELLIGTELTGKDMWASPFLGVVPAPQCPAGYSRVITITPAGFMMSQAGQMVRRPHEIADQGGDGNRFVIDPNNERVNQLAGVTLAAANSTITGASYITTSFTDAGGTPHNIYYLGHATEPSATKGGNPYSPEPLYFQQSTWLKSKVMPQKQGKKGPCGPGHGVECGPDFLGWSTVMGFIYPGRHYADIIKRIIGDDKVFDSKAMYWNVFPVMVQTLEAYATVYCYFDRTNIDDSGNSSQYVDQYDQLNNFRFGYNKIGAKTYDKKGKESTNAEYIKRLNDPTLKYDNPW